MQTKARSGHVSRRLSRIQSRQNIAELACMLGLNAPLAASLENLCSPLCLKLLITRLR